MIKHKWVHENTLHPVWLHWVRKSISLRCNLLLLAVFANNPSIFKIMRALMSEERELHCGCNRGHASQRTHHIKCTDTWQETSKQTKKCIKSGTNISSNYGGKNVASERRTDIFMKASTMGSLIKDLMRKFSSFYKCFPSRSQSFACYNSDQQCKHS